MSGILLDMNRYAPPAASAFGTKYNAGLPDPGITDTSGRGLVFNFGAGSISNNTDYVKACVKAKASSPTTYDLIARIHHSLLFNFSMAGICIADGTKLVTFGFGPTSGATHGVKVTQWTNHTTFNSDRLANFPVSPKVEWLKIGVISGVPTDFYISHNGTDWAKILSEAQSGFLTYTQVGLASVVNAQAGSSWALNSTERMFFSCLYFADPDIVPGF
jgi:hypothetical protein